jgi:hypothetical protein
VPVLERKILYVKLLTYDVKNTDSIPHESERFLATRFMRIRFKTSNHLPNSRRKNVFALTFLNSSTVAAAFLKGPPWSVP